MTRKPAGLPSTSMLAHFTRASEDLSALDNLVRILKAGLVRGATRMVRSGRRAVCLFDASTDELRRVLVRQNHRRYEPFGIAVDKRYAFRLGARPVIYMPFREADAMLKPEEIWRVVGIDLDCTPPVDWTYEREWRLLGDLPLEPGLSVALVETWLDVEEVFDRFSGKPPCAGVIPLRERFELS